MNGPKEWTVSYINQKNYKVVLDFYDNTLVKTVHGNEHMRHVEVRRGVFDGTNLLNGVIWSVDELIVARDAVGVAIGYAMSKQVVQEGEHGLVFSKFVYDRAKECVYGACLMPFSHLKCARCGVYYHSRACQVADWPTHKAQCLAKEGQEEEGQEEAEGAEKDITSPIEDAD